MKDTAENIDEETENHEALAEESKDTVPEKVNISFHRFLTGRQKKVKTSFQIITKGVGC